MNALESVAGVVRRHSLAVRTVLLEVALVTVAWLVISTWQSEMANVAFGILMIFAFVFAAIGTLVGGTIAVGRMVRS